jgi:hypothetical protein
MVTINIIDVIIIVAIAFAIVLIWIVAYFKRAFFDNNLFTVIHAIITVLWVYAFIYSLDWISHHITITF